MGRTRRVTLHGLWCWEANGAYKRRGGLAEALFKRLQFGDVLSHLLLRPSELILAGRKLLDRLPCGSKIGRNALELLVEFCRSWGIKRLGFLHVRSKFCGGRRSSCWSRR